MLLEITHETVFEYSQPVAESYVELRLTPVSDGSQHLLQHRQRVTPAVPVRQYVDALGNAVSYFNHIAPHDRIEVMFESVVETFTSRVRGAGVPASAQDSPATRLMLHDYRVPTPLTAPTEAFLEYARKHESLRSLPVSEAAFRLAASIFDTFEYKGEVTNVSSPIDDVLKQGRGVCQDFAHLMIATLRYFGFASRYVSGYVIPEANPDQAVASHAWCEVFEPEHGWLGVDPTHNCWVEERYVRLGVGRDFRDVPPNRGLYRGAGEEAMHVTVRINPITSEELGHRARVLYQTPQRQPLPASRSSRSKSPPVSLMQQSMIAQQQQQQQQQ